MRQLLLIRHPETEANAAGRYEGVQDSPYTQAGERRVVEIAREVRAWSPDAVRTSPRGRALRLAMRVDGAAVVVDAGLSEIDFGVNEGLTFDEVALQGTEGEGFFERLVTPTALASFHEQVRETLARATGGEGSRVALVSHGGTIRCALALLLNTSFEEAWEHPVPAGSLTLVELGAEGARLVGSGT